MSATTDSDEKDLDEMRKKLERAEFSVSCMRCSSQITTVTEHEDDED